MAEFILKTAAEGQTSYDALLRADRTTFNNSLDADVNSVAMGSAMARGKIRPRRRPLGESKPRFCVQRGPAPCANTMCRLACRSYWA